MEVAPRPNYLSRGRYSDWTEQDIINHLKRVSEEIGRKPTKGVLWQRINEQGLDEPSPRQIEKWMPFRAALEAIGYPDIFSWETADYVEWGTKFVLANDGFLPTATSLDYLSKLKRGPSAAQIGNVFRTINSYKSRVLPGYRHKLKEVETHKLQRGKEIKEDLDSGKLPVGIFHGVKSGQEMIYRYAKYRLVDSILPDNFLSVRIKIGTEEISDSVMVAELKPYIPEIDLGTLQKTAADLGLLCDIWPPDENLLELLKVPSEFMETRRIKLSGMPILLQA